MEEYPAAVCHKILSLYHDPSALGLLTRLTPDLTHTPTPLHSEAPVSSKHRTAMYMNTPIQQYQIIHTANEGKTKLSHSNIKTAGAIQQFKRHEPHTWYTGQCSFHWGYILALLWINNDMYVTQCNKQAIQPYMDIPIPVFMYMDEAMQDRQPDCDVQKCFFSSFNSFFCFVFLIKVGSKIKI